MAELTQEQRRSVESSSKTVLLTAGAGSGKTTVLVEKYLSILRTGTLPRNILALTFTTAAGEQLRDRIGKELKRQGSSAKLIEQVESSPYIGTLHAFCYYVVSLYGPMIELPPIERILSALDSPFYFERHFKQWLASLSEEALRECLQFYSLTELRSVAKTCFDEPSLFLDAGRVTRLDRENDGRLAPLLGHLSAFLNGAHTDLSRQGIYSFDDLESLSLRILQSLPQVRQSLQKQITHILVDEFQDTSPRQWELLNLLLSETSSRFLVGDPKQSIYSFRGADARLFMHLQGSIRDDRHSEALDLTYNFRSAPRLLDSINIVSERLFDGATVPFFRMQAGGGEPAGDTGLCIRRYLAEGVRGVRVQAEIEQVVSRVQQLLLKDVPPKDIVLLFRASDRMPQYLEALTKAGIDASSARQTPLAKSYTVQDVWSYFETLCDPLNDFWFSAFLRSGFMQRSRAELFALRQRPGKTLWEKTREEPSLDWLHSWIKQGNLKAGSALRVLFQNTQRIPSDSDVFLKIVENLRPGDSVFEMAEKLSAWTQSDTATTPAEISTGVSLRTVHAAKGLEFDHVLLVDCERLPSRSYPKLRMHRKGGIGFRYRDPATQESATTRLYDQIERLQSEQEQEESKRVLYVALTRAKVSLTLFLPEKAEGATGNTKVASNSWAAWLLACLQTETAN